MLIARKQSWLIVVAVVLVAVGAAFLFKPSSNSRAGNSPVLQSATLYPEPRALTPFQLLDQDAKAFTNADLMGHWSFVFFGFTQCPDICPTTLAVMANVAKQLPPEFATDTRFVFVTVDPERDTPALLHDYVNWFNFGLVGVTGDVAAITALARDMGVAFSKVAQGDSYVMDHSVRVFLLDGQGRRHALLAPSLGLQGFDAKVVVQDYLAIRNQ